MSEIVTSILNKNSMIYSSEVTTKNEGPNCVAGKGEQAEGIVVNPAEAPVKAVREKQR